MSAILRFAISKAIPLIVLLSYLKFLCHGTRLCTLKGAMLSEQIIGWREQYPLFPTRHRINSYHIIQDTRIFSLSSEAIALSLPLFCNRNYLVNDQLNAFSLGNRTPIAILILSHDFPLAKTSWRPEVADDNISECSKWETDGLVSRGSSHRQRWCRRYR